MSVQDNHFTLKENFMTTVVLKAANYTEDQVLTITAAYAAGDSLESIAASVGKSVPSVRAKLAALKVYVSKAATTKPENKGAKVNKEGLKAYLESLVGKDLLNVEAASKDALLLLIDAIKSRDDKIQGLIDDMLCDNAQASDSSLV